jgi:hypothetical protein
MMVHMSFRSLKLRCPCLPMARQSMLNSDPPESLGFGPEGIWAAEKQTGQRHRQDLVRHAVYVPHRPGHE